MKRRAVVAVLVATCVVLIVAIAIRAWQLYVRPLPAFGKQANLNSAAKPNYALLPETEAVTYAKLFSDTSSTDLRSWEPTVADVEALEANLLQVSALRENARSSPRYIDNPNRYFRQYLAVFQHGKKWIFVNAFCEIPADDSNRWRKHIELAADGGTCYWRAWYDPAAQRFSNLIINGVG